MWGYFMNAPSKAVWEMHLLHLNNNWAYLYLTLDMLVITETLTYIQNECPLLLSLPSYRSNRE